MTSHYQDNPRWIVEFYNAENIRLSTWYYAANKKEAKKAFEKAHPGVEIASIRKAAFRTL